MQAAAQVDRAALQGDHAGAGVCQAGRPVRSRRLCRLRCEHSGMSNSTATAHAATSAVGCQQFTIVISAHHDGGLAVNIVSQPVSMRSQTAAAARAASVEQVHLDEILAMLLSQTTLSNKATAANAALLREDTPGLNCDLAAGTLSGTHADETSSTARGRPRCRSSTRCPAVTSVRRVSITTGSPNSSPSGSLQQSDAFRQVPLHSHSD